MCRSQASAHQARGLARPGRPGEQRAAGSARGRVGWIRLRPAVAHTPDSGLSAGSCVAPGASGSAPVPCPARPVEPAPQVGTEGRSRGGRGLRGAGRAAAGRGSPRRPWASEGPGQARGGAEGGAGLALPCPVLPYLALPGPAPGWLPRRDHPGPSGDRGPAGQRGSSRARRALVQTCRL